MRHGALTDAFTFVGEWAKNPLQVAAVLPSGPQLAELITSEIDTRSGHVLELGPGTGVFTQCLLDRGVCESQITLIEQTDTFANILSSRFPDANLVRRDAASIAPMRLSEEGPAGAAVSGIGLRSLPQTAVERIVAAAFAQLKRDGSFYQFTYGLTCPVSRNILRRLDLVAECIGIAWRNLPPARVYRLRRRDPELDTTAVFLAAARGAPPIASLDTAPAGVAAPAWTREGELQSQI